MTVITTSEIKILAIQVILMALLGAFMALYSVQPAEIGAPIGSVVSSNTTVSATDQSWISSIISLPSGMGDLAFITLLIIAPFVFFDAMIALRFAKDIATGWI
ncbi:MAG: hypothetical protein PHQ22_10550 [Sulfuricurvum sp.]|nr:hypothetical protein [Sulfuricurvum sp.]